MSNDNYEEILIDHVECCTCSRVVDRCDAEPIDPDDKRGDWVCDWCVEGSGDRHKDDALYDDVAEARLCARFGAGL